MQRCTPISFVLWVLLFIATILFFTVPLAVTDLRQKHLGSDYEEIQQVESKALDNLRTFRDVPWEMFTKAHESMATTPMLYYPIASLIFAFNFVLWYLWFPFRLLVDKKVTLLVSLYMFEFCELVVNSFTQFPPPPGFVQLEFESLSFFLGMVTQGGYGMLSSRAAFSFLLWYDGSYSLWPDRHIRRRVFTAFYAFNICLFLLCTHQMYSVSLALNLLTSFAVFHLSRTWAADYERSLQQRTGAVVELPAPPKTARYTIDDEDDDPELTEAGVDVVLYSRREAEISRPQLSPSSRAKHCDLDAPANQVTDDL